MKPHICDLCGYVYFPQLDNIDFKDLANNWICPCCGSHKEDFFVRSSENQDQIDHKPEIPDSEVWEEQLSSLKEGQEPLLPDFSYAGWDYSETAIPEASGKIFNVLDFGAEPDRDGSDREAVIKTIRAAEANCGGIVLFPPGKYNLNEEKGCSEPIVINGSNIVLKGSGTDKTELYMREHLEPVDPEYMWTTPSLFTFQPVNNSIEDKQLTTITSDSRRETFIIEVEDSSKLEIGQTISLYNRSPDATSEFMDGREPWDIWTSTVEKGPLIMEKHKIKSIDGNIITLREPLHINIISEHGWQVWSVTMVPGWRVEDLTFRGGWRETLIHHKNYIHDSGWSFLSVIRGESPIVQNVDLIDINAGINYTNCFTGSIMNINVKGNRGHIFIHAAGGCYGTLIANCSDLTDEGMWHGPGANKASCGTVLYNYKGKAKSGPDFHASWPYCTLIDNCSSGLVGNGGAHNLLPNHGKYLVWWNHEHLGEPLNNYDFFEDRKGNEFYSGCKAVSPWIIGYHNAGHTSFVESSLAKLEGLGQRIKPDSLFIEQLKLRGIRKNNLFGKVSINNER